MLLIEILITPKQFEHYNSRLPKDDMELRTYAHKTAEFIREAINTENPKMIGGLWIKQYDQPDEDYREALAQLADSQAEVERLKELLRYPYELPMNIAGDYDANTEWNKKAEQALKG